MNTMLWIFLGLTALWMSLRYLPAGADRHRPLVELIALIDLLSPPLLVLLVWAILIQAWPQTALALVELTLVSVWRLQYRLHSPFTTGSGRQGQRHQGSGADTSIATRPGANADLLTLEPTSPNMTDSRLEDPHTTSQALIAEQATTSLTVMTLNCRYGKAAAQDILDQAQNHRVDVLALQEVNATLLENLRTAGMGQTLPYLVEGSKTTNDNGGRNALFSRSEPVESQPASLDLHASAVPLIVLQTGSGPVQLASVHPRSPQRGAQQWGLGIERLALLKGSDTEQIADSDSNSGHGNVPARSPVSKSSRLRVTESTPTIILGDCNANLHHPTFRAMLRTSRLHDASLTLGNGPHPTFPHFACILPAMIEIDHILISQSIKVKSVKTLEVPGTDHYGLLAKLYL